MPSITVSYLYTFTALIAVSSLLIFSFMAYTNTLQAFSETKQLRNLINYVATKTTELLTLVLTTNASADAFLQMPQAVGNKQYWIKLSNDSAKTWVEGGLGNLPAEQTELWVFIPKEALATGHYIGGYGAAHLKCNANAGVPQIQLASSAEGD